MIDFFLSVWDEREDPFGKVYCYETGMEIHPSLRENTCIYHHVLEKSDYPQYKLSKWNIVLVLPEIHTKLHSDLDLAPKVRKLRETLLNKIKEEL